MKLHISTESARREAIKELVSIPANGMYSVEIKKLPKKRTTRQNKALHVYKGWVAKELNDMQLTVQEVIKYAIDIDWNEEMVLELLWRRLQVVITGKKSTTEPTPEEYILIYDTLNRHLSKMGVTVPWPVKNKED